MKRLLLFPSVCMLFVIATTGCRFVENHHSVVQKEEQKQVEAESQDTKEPKKEEPPTAIPDDGVVESEIQAEKNEFLDYQLGDHWSRLPTKAFHYNHRTVLRASVSTDFGLVTANVVVLKILSPTRALFVTAAHAFPECKDGGVVLRTKELQLNGYCGTIYSVIPGTDAVIFSLEFFDEEITDDLIPVEFSEFVEQGERLKFFTMGDDSLIGGYFPLYADTDIDCMMISSGEKAIEDPDPVHPVKNGPFWSIAVSCDAIHGDSGGLLVNRANQMVGILWTGAFPKSREFTTQDLLLRSQGGAPDDPRVWTGLNYAVPAYRIQLHMNELLAN